MLIANGAVLDRGRRDDSSRPGKRPSRRDLGSAAEGQINYAGYFWLTEGGPARQRRRVSSSFAAVPSSWEEYAKALGIELQRRRIALDVTQENLAHRAGLTRTHYQQLERRFWKPGSPANPSLKSLVRLAQVLQLEVGELLPSGNSVEWPGE